MSYNYAITVLFCIMLCEFYILFFILQMVLLMLYIQYSYTPHHVYYFYIHLNPLHHRSSLIGCRADFYCTASTVTVMFNVMTLQVTVVTVAAGIDFAVTLVLWL